MPASAKFLKKLVGALAILILAAGCSAQNPTAPAATDADPALQPTGASFGVFANGEG